MLLWKKENIAASLGNILEWYDFCLYGYFAPLLAQAFFPNQNPSISLLYLLLTFASGYVARPIGGLIFGHFGDILGPGKALYYAIYLISFPTFLIGLLPGYAILGAYAPLMLIFIRLLQGLSAGGQYSGALTYLCKNNPPQHRSSAASTAYLGSLGGFLLASGIGAMTTTFYDNQLAWRIPFLASILLVIPLEFYKHQLSVAPKNPVKSQHLPIITLLKSYKVVTAKSFLLASIGGVYYTSFFVFLISYLNNYVNLKMSAIFWLNTICLISSALTIGYFAKLADHYGRKPILLVSSFCLALLIYPAFLLLNTKYFVYCLFGAWLVTTANTAFMAACAVVYVEIFPEEIQYTGCAVSYNLGAGLVGGFTPALLVFILNRFGFFTMNVLLTLSAAFAVLFTYACIPETLPKQRK
ncbi:MAG: proP [Gammaproteobacteria bacterium]|jgi:MHS family proline/betaine transporter-like MFS transporter|nr:proP [Gammaproteobacteria bacterium]